MSDPTMLVVAHWANLSVLRAETLASSAVNSDLVADAIEAALGTFGELVSVVTVPPVMVRDAAAQTAVATSAARRTAVPVLDPTGTPLATLDAAGTAQTPTSPPP